MKKYLLVVMSVLLMLNYSIGQNAYYDALELKNYNWGINPDTKMLTYQADNDTLNTKNLINILNRPLEEKLTYPELVKNFSENPFFRLSENLSQSVKGLKSDDSAKSSSIISSISGLDVTNIADGLAKFMVERTKQELNAYFFEEFKSQLKNSEELNTLFPQTTMHLSAIGNEIYNYNAYIQGLRESFEFDLSNIFIQTPKLLDIPKYKKDLDKFPELRYILKTGFYIINELDKNVHPGDILHQFPDQFQSDSAPKNLINGIHLVDLFSQSLRSKSPESYWISPDSLRLLNDKTVFRIYLGLIYQQTPENIEFEYFVKNKKKTVHFKSLLDSLGKNINEYEEDIVLYQKYLQNLSQRFSNTETALKKLNNKTNKNNPDPKDLYTYIQSCLDLINYSIQITDLPYTKDLLQNNTEVFQSIRDYTSIANQAANIYLNVSERNYGTAIISLTQITKMIADQIPTKNYNNSIAFINKIYELDTIKNKNNTEYFEKRKEELEKEMEVKKTDLYTVSGKILKYGSFMASIVQAENSDDVQTIIESAAMPAGSFRVKRESAFNVSLNAYCGLFYGTEKIKGADLGATQINFHFKQHWNSYGVSAPVGISISFGQVYNSLSNSDKFIRHSSHSLFFSIIDIGALTSFRFTNDSTESVPNIELKDIISPGVFYSLGIPKSPLSINIGYQMGPLLRKVNMDENLYGKNYSRFSISLCVDIPILNFYTKPKK